MTSTFYDLQLARLDGLKALLKTWEGAKPDHPYVLGLRERIANPDPAVEGTAPAMNESEDYPQPAWNDWAHDPEMAADIARDERYWNGLSRGYFDEEDLPPEHGELK